MHYFLTLSLLISCLLSFGQENSTLIRNVDFFDGENSQKGVYVLFEEGKIIKISKRKIKAKGAKVIEGEGHTLIPPLLNSHVHVWFPKNLQDALKHGIFALLDMHSNDFFANSMRTNNGKAGYGYYYSSNAGATVPEGHGTQFGIPVPTINDTLSPKKFVEDRNANHADYIKILKEPRRATLTTEQTQEVIQTAHAHEMLAVAHVSKLDDALELAGQEVDGFVHVWLDRAASEDEWKTLEEADVYMAPTLRVYQKYFEQLEKEGKETSLLSFEGLLKEVKAAHEAGIPILAGTDAPNFALNYTSELFEEIILLGKAGLSNEEALQAASANIYRNFQLKEFSLVQEGGPASFSLVKGKPLENLEDIRNEKRVFQKGIELDQPK